MTDTKPRVIAYDEAVTALNAAVATQPDGFCYTSDGGGCYYGPLPADEHGRRVFGVTDDDPRTKTGCLIGVALGILGVEFNTHFASGFRSLAHQLATGTHVLDLDGERHMAPYVLFTDKVYTMYGIAQEWQDQGKTWGESAAYAIARSTNGVDEVV